MNITRIRTKLFEIELPRPLGDANSPQGRTRASALVVYVDTDAGLTGISFANPGTGSAIHGFEPLLVGACPRGVRGLWKRMVDKVFKGGNEGTANEALSSLDKRCGT